MYQKNNGYNEHNMSKNIDFYKRLKV